MVKIIQLFKKMTSEIGKIVKCGSRRSKLTFEIAKIESKMVKIESKMVKLELKQLEK